MLLKMISPREGFMQRIQACKYMLTYQMFTMELLSLQEVGFLSFLFTDVF